MLSLLVVGLYLSLVGGAIFATPDFSWSPSYFDDDDNDFLSVLLTDQAPVLPAPAVALLPFLAALATAVLLIASARSLLARSLSRLRAPPLL